MRVAPAAGESTDAGDRNADYDAVRRDGDDFLDLGAKRRHQRSGLLVDDGARTPARHALPGNSSK
jgi:hypothetical protein